MLLRWRFTTGGNWQWIHRNWLKYHGSRRSNVTHSRLFVLFALFSAGTYAQWVNYPDAAIPRTPDGKPNLAAPAPRAPDGKPDLTGVWMHETTTVAEVKRLFGNIFDAEIELAPPGMEIGTQHKYAFNILLDFRPEESPMRPQAAEIFRQRLAAGPFAEPCVRIS